MATTMARSGPVVEITFELPAHQVAPPAKCTQSQASEIAQSKRLLKKPGRTPPLLSSKRDESKRSIVIRTQADADKTSRIKGRL